MNTHNPLHTQAKHRKHRILRCIAIAAVTPFGLSSANAGVPTVSEFSALTGSAATRGELGSAIEVVGSRIAIGSPAADAQGTEGGGPPPQDTGAVSRWERGAAGKYIEMSSPIIASSVANGRFGTRLDSFNTRLAATQATPPRVYIYDFAASATLEQTLVPQLLGASGSLNLVSVSTFADYAAVGVVRNFNNSGSVEFFRRIGGQWTSTHTINSPTPTAANIAFGYSTTMTEDRVFIGAPYFDPVGGEVLAGAVFEYGRPEAGTVWPLRNILTLPPSAPVDQPALFGFSTDSSGTLMVAGAPQFRSTLSGPEIGAVVVHEFDPGSNAWVRVATLLNPDAEAESNFGAAVATDGQDIIVGSPNGNGGNGVAYWYRRSGPGSWELVQRMIRTATGSHDFGAAVSFTSEASAVIGAPGFVNVRGAAYEFRTDRLLSDGFE